jgi:hypothetical protein
MAGSSTMSRRLAAAIGLLIAAPILAGQPLAVSASPPSPPPAVPAQSRRIDQELAKQWQANHLSPSRPTTDFEFIRRASLDIIGRIATPDEIKRFLNDPARSRRTMLIERLLDSQEYAKNWASIWTIWLMTRTGPDAYRDQMHSWLEQQFSRTDCAYDRVVSDLITATGKTSANGSVNFVLAHVGEPVPRGKEREEGQFNMVPITWRSARLFLGVQLQCAQCHDHPQNDLWKQQHFWGLNAFFRQVERKGPRMMSRTSGPAPELELTDNTDWNRDSLVLYEKRNAVVLPAKPMFLDGSRVAPKAGVTRRRQLAELIVADPHFGRAYINRMWAHFFGRGLNAPGAFDDFNDENPVNFPELLDYLSSEFKSSGYSPRTLVRWICNSSAYQLSAVANGTNAAPDADRYFSRMLIKSMSPEQLFESLMVVTQADAKETQTNRKKLRDDWMRNLVVNFGDDEGNEITFNGTIVQALLLMNGPQINYALTKKDGGPIVSVLVRPGSNPRTVIDDLFVWVLNRHATQAELKEIPGKLNLHARETDVTAPWQDLVWALVNSNEFILNH